MAYLLKKFARVQKTENSESHDPGERNKNPLHIKTISLYTITANLRCVMLPTYPSRNIYFIYRGFLPQAVVVLKAGPQ